MEIWIIEDYANFEKMFAIVHDEAAHIISWYIADIDKPGNYTLHKYNDS